MFMHLCKCGCSKRVSHLVRAHTYMHTHTLSLHSLPSTLFSPSLSPPTQPPLKLTNNKPCSPCADPEAMGAWASGRAPPLSVRLSACTFNSNPDLLPISPAPAHHLLAVLRKESAPYAPIPLSIIDPGGTPSLEHALIFAVGESSHGIISDVHILLDGNVQPFLPFVGTYCLMATCSFSFLVWAHTMEMWQAMHSRSGAIILPHDHEIIPCIHIDQEVHHCHAMSSEHIGSSAQAPGGSSAANGTEQRWHQPRPRSRSPSLFSPAGRLSLQLGTCNPATPSMCVAPLCPSSPFSCTAVGIGWTCAIS